MSNEERIVFKTSREKKLLFEELVKRVERLRGREFRNRDELLDFIISLLRDWIRAREVTVVR